MRTLYVVTHPEATHHVDELVGGWHDSRLTSAGERAAVAVAQTLRARIPTAADVELYSSDLRRAAKTADLVGDALGTAPVLDRRLREKSYGQAEGKPKGAVPLVPPPPAGNRMRHREGPGAETRATFARRIYEVMDTILASTCAHQVIVTHGFAVTFVIASWIRMPLDSLDFVNFRTEAGGITLLREDDHFHNRQLAVLGDVGHLRG